MPLIGSRWLKSDSLDKLYLYVKITSSNDQRPARRSRKDEVASQKLPVAMPKVNTIRMPQPKAAIALLLVMLGSSLM